MKYFTYILSLTLLIACEANTQTKEGFNQKSLILSPKDFENELSNNKDFYLIDVRTPKEFQAGTITGAQNLDLLDGTFESAISGLDSTKATFIFCAKGGRSGRAAKLLESKGFHKIIDLKGGYQEWVQSQ